METGSNLVNESGETLDEIVSVVKNVTQIVGEISAASQEQSTGIEQVNRAILEMDEITQQNAALVEEVTAMVEVIVSGAMFVATVLFPVAAIGILLVYSWPTPLRITVLLWLSPIVIATIAPLIPGFDLFGRGYEPVNVLIVAEIGLLLSIARAHQRERLSTNQINIG